MPPRHRAKLKVKKINSLLWLFEPIFEEESYLQRRMFSCEVAYLHGRMMLAVVDHEEPWNGLLVCTSREQHQSLQSDYPELQPHEVLGKWLYLSQAHPEFERVATTLVNRARKGDQRIGVEPRPRKPRKSKS